MIPGIVASQRRSAQAAVGFPVVRSAGAFATAGQQSTMPVQVSGMPGDLVIIRIASRSTSATFSISGGPWMQLGSKLSTGASIVELVFWRVLDSAVSDVTVTASSATSMSASSVTVQSGTHAAEIEGAYLYGSTAVPNITPSWGEADTLLIASYSHANGSEVLDYPLPDNQHYARSTATTSGVVNGVCALSLRSETLSAPGVWVLSGSGSSRISRSIAVRPA